MLTWVESGGGPLILVPANLLSRWRGTDPAGAPVSGDYARACAQPGFASLISVAGGTGLVLGEDPMPATWWSEVSGSAGALVRWEYADNDEAVQAVLAGDLHVVEAQAPLGWEVLGPLQLFDSAWPGDEAPQKLEIPLPTGKYSVTSEWVRPNSETSLLVHRFLKTAGER